MLDRLRRDTATLIANFDRLDESERKLLALAVLITCVQPADAATAMAITG